MITGTRELRDGDEYLVLTRTFAAPVEDLWAAITESERLGRWFCTWTGDPDTGPVDVTWAFEDGMPVEPYAVDECHPPHHLRVHNVHDDPAQVWTLDARLSEEGGRTVLTFAQVLTGAPPVTDVGPGWEYYLDRLADSLRTGTVSDLRWSDYEDLGTEYAAAFGSG